MATKLEQVRDEMLAARAEMAPRREGFRDFAALNLTSEARDEAQRSLQNYDRRDNLLAVAVAALEAVLADGYPLLEPREISQAALADLVENQRTITAALAQFKPITADKLGIAAGAPEAKP